MRDIVFLNGNFIPSEEATISVFDHGFLYGDGLFETMRSYNGKIFKVDNHLDRLQKSAGVLDLKIPYSVAELKKALNRIIEINGENLYIRLTVSRGPGPVGIDPRLCPQPTVVITSKEISYNDRLYSQGARAVFVKTMRNLAGAVIPEVKSLNFLNNILAKMEVTRVGADEGFMLNYLGQVTEGTVSNIFMVKSGSLLTPAPDAGILAGITRMTVIDLAGELGIPVVEKLLYKDDFVDADEVFYTNSGSEIVPVTMLDGEAVGGGAIGTITGKLIDKYRRLAWGCKNYS